MFKVRIKAATALVAALALGADGPVAAQSNVTTAVIQGTVRDDAGGGLPGVSVEGVNSETGFRRLAVTDGQGRYLLTLLPPGKYAVTAALSGFSSAKRDGLVLALGSTTVVDLGLKLSGVAETVTVTGEAPVVETTKSDVSASVNDVAIQNLPLATRNFTDLVVLTPGATSDDTGRVHLGGQRGINNSFNVDGADSNSSFFGEQRGGTRPPFTFSQGSIKEFQVIQSSYNAQYGNASGGVINAITKSGTNDFHGEVFGFYRSKALQQTDAAGFRSNEFEQKQYGGFLGGPIVKDRFFFFGGYDAQKLSDPFQAAWDNRGTATDPLTGSSAAANLAALAKYGINPDTEWGEVNQTNDVYSPFVKLSWNASDSVTVSLRDNYNNGKGENLTNGRQFSNNGISNNGLERNTFNSLVGNVNWAASASFFDELILQGAKEHRPRIENTKALPETIIGGFGRFGQNNFLPNNLDETRYQVINNATYYMGETTIKAGFDVSRIEYVNEFYRYRNGVYTFNNGISSFVTLKPTNFRQAFSSYDGKVSYDTNNASFYLQDEWRPSNRLTVNFGIRYEYQEQPDSEDVNPKYPDVQSIPSDRNNWAPRFGIAWDPDGAGKGVVRAGIGVFYNVSPSLLTANALLNNGVRVLDYNVSCTNAAIKCPTYPSLVTGPADLLANPSFQFPAPNIFVVDRNFQNPETTRVSVSYEREVVKDLSVGVDAIYSRTRFLERVQDANLQVVGVTADGRPRYGNPNNPVRPNANFAAIQIFKSDADGAYKALIFSVRKRWSSNFQFNASYALSESKDSQSNERSVSIASNTTEDSFNPNNDYSFSDFDVRHNIVVSGVITVPLGIRVSPLYRWRSGVPYTATNFVDVNGDLVFNDRANDLVNCDSAGRCDLGPAHVERNGERQQRFQQLDLTISKEFTFGPVGITLYGQGFNITNTSNRGVTGGNLNKVISAGTVSGVQKYQYNANFGAFNRVGPPRQFQLGARISF